MNRFETLLAPPSLPPKDLRIHIRTHPEIAPEVSSACSSELVNVGVRLHDELSTLRFPRKLGTEAPPDGYPHTMRLLTGSSASPIPWPFFAVEYTTFTQDHGDLATEVALRESVKCLDDPWRVQAWAAQALRVAQNAELEDPGNAASAWRVAVVLYREFFGRASVTESYTYGFQSDPLAQASCAAAWDSFLAEELHSLVNRAQDHVKHQRPESVAAVHEVLAVREVRAINPAMVAEALATAKDNFVAGIRTAPSLRAALDMYARSTPSDDSERALLDCMAQEVNRVGQGFGDIESIDEAGRLLDLTQRPDSAVGTLVRASRNAFYEAAVSLAASAMPDDASPEAKKLAARVLAWVPGDRVVVKRTTDSETITVAHVQESLWAPTLGPKLQALLDSYMEADADSAEEEQSIEAVIEFAAKNPAFAALPQTSQAIRMALTSAFRGAAARSLGADGTRGLRVMRKIRKALPDDATIAMGDEELTPKQWIKKLRLEGTGALPPDQRLHGLLREALNLPPGSSSHADAVAELISLARTNTLPSDAVEAIHAALKAFFVVAAGRYLEDPLRRPDCVRIMRDAAGFLPPTMRLEFGGETASATDHANKVQGLANLKVSQQAPAGSQDEQLAVKALIALLGEGIDFRMGNTTFREGAETSMRAVAVANLGSSGNPDTLRLVAEWLGSVPSSTGPQRSVGKIGSRAALIVGWILNIVLFVGWLFAGSFFAGFFDGNLVQQIVVWVGWILVTVLVLGAIARRVLK